jgi:hypothetical protein
MTGWMMIAGAVLALATGLWIGFGAPGWPQPEHPRTRRLEKRPLNPIAWGRSSQQRPESRGGRRRR